MLDLDKQRASTRRRVAAFRARRRLEKRGTTVPMTTREVTDYARAIHLARLAAAKVAEQAKQPE
jgi:hypothetical protein